MKSHSTLCRSLVCGLLASFALIASTSVSHAITTIDRAITLTEENGVLTVSGANASDWETPTARAFGEGWNLNYIQGGGDYFQLRNEAAWSEPGETTHNFLSKTAFIGSYAIFSDDPSPVPTDFLSGADSTAIVIPYSQGTVGGNYYITFIDKGDHHDNTVPEGGSTAVLVAGAGSLLCFLRKRCSPQV